MRDFLAKFYNDLTYGIQILRVLIHFFLPHTRWRRDALVEKYVEKIETDI